MTLQLSNITINGGPPTIIRDPLFHVRHEETANTAGGASSAATWNTRTLNNTPTNQITGASLSANQFTLAAGTYYIQAWSLGHRADRQKIRLRNITDVSTEIVGGNGFNNDSDSTSVPTFLRGEFTITAEKTFELQHYTEVAQATQGLGVAVNAGEVEIYADVMIWQRNAQEVEIVVGTLHVRDEKSSGTQGGSSTSGSYATRDLNTVLTNTITGASLASDQITLPAGTYEVDARCPAFSGFGHKARLQDTTGAATLILGSTQFARDGNFDQTDATVKGRFTLSVESLVELQHRVATADTGDGLGIASVLGDNEVYGEVIIRKLEL